MAREIIIEKAAIPLQTGETVDAYLRKIGDATQAKFGAKPSRNGEGGIYIWTRAVFKDTVVFEKSGGAIERKLFSTKYQVKDDGSVEFLDTPTEVREVVSFEPVSKESGIVTKRESDFWRGLPIIR